MRTAEFPAMLSSLVQSWYDKWKETASKIEHTVSVKAPKVLDPGSLRELIYDDLSMGRSEFYFGLLQLLRIFSETVTTIE